MKKIIIISSLILLASLKLTAQAPEGINYQATVRDASGNLLTNQSALLLRLEKQPQ